MTPDQPSFEYTRAKKLLKIHGKNHKKAHVWEAHIKAYDKANKVKKDAASA
jgi:hypothetical protein